MRDRDTTLAFCDTALLHIRETSHADHSTDSETAALALPYYRMAR